MAADHRDLLRPESDCHYRRNFYKCHKIMIVLLILRKTEWQILYSNRICLMDIIFYVMAQSFAGTVIVFG